MFENRLIFNYFMIKFFFVDSKNRLSDRIYVSINSNNRCSTYSFVLFSYFFKKFSVDALWNFWLILCFFYCKYFYIKKEISHENIFRHNVK